MRCGACFEIKILRVSKQQGLLLQRQLIVLCFKQGRLLKIQTIQLANFRKIIKPLLSKSKTIILGVIRKKIQEKIARKQTNFKMPLHIILKQPADYDWPCPNIAKFN